MKAFLIFYGRLQKPYSYVHSGVPSQRATIHTWRLSAQRYDLRKLPQATWLQQSWSSPRSPPCCYEGGPRRLPFIMMNLTMITILYPFQHLILGSYAWTIPACMIVCFCDVRIWSLSHQIPSQIFNIVLLCFVLFPPRPLPPSLLALHTLSNWNGMSHASRDHLTAVRLFFFSPLLWPLNWF